MSDIICSYCYCIICFTIYLHIFNINIWLIWSPYTKFPNISFLMCKKYCIIFTDYNNYVWMISFDDVVIVLFVSLYICIYLISTYDLKDHHTQSFQISHFWCVLNIAKILISIITMCECYHMAMLLLHHLLLYICIYMI